MILNSLVDCVIPDMPREKTTLNDTSDKLITFLREISILMTYGFFILLVILELMPILTLKSIKPFSFLDRKNRRIFFAGLLESRFMFFRNVARLLLSPILLVYFSQKNVIEYIGYEGDKWIADRLKEFKDDGARILEG